MKKKVLLVANYWHFESEKASSRYRSFADMLCEKYDLEVVTSTFCHLKKSQRRVEELGLDTLPYKTTLCYEKGYKKNISLKRISSYKQFGKNVQKYLSTQEKPDVIIVSVPSLSVADYTTKYARENNIPVIVDIQDLWPEAFKMALDIPVVSDILFYPMKKQAERIYSRADTIMAVSDTYVAFGKKSNEDCHGLSIYIGTDSLLVEEKVAGKRVVKPENEFWVGYVGALGHSYDIKLVIDALSNLKKDKNIDNIVFYVMGDGVLKNEYEEYGISKGVNCVFTGLLEYGEMMCTLKECDVAVNPIVGKSVSSIINKVSDYAAAGTPVVNTQNSEEYRRLLEENQAGINVENGNVDMVAEAICKLYNDNSLRQSMRQNSLAMFEKYFDRQKTYPKLIEEIERLTENK